MQKNSPSLKNQLKLIFAAAATTAAAASDWCSLKWFFGSPVFKKTPRSKLLQERDTFLESTKEKKCLTKIWTDTTGTFSTSFCVSTNLIDCFVSEVQLNCINFFLLRRKINQKFKFWLTRPRTKIWLQKHFCENGKILLSMWKQSLSIDICSV